MILALSALNSLFGKAPHLTRKIGSMLRRGLRVGCVFDWFVRGGPADRLAEGP
jgi:hypothetical protein